MSLFFNKNAWFIGAFPFLRSGIFLSVLDKYPVMCLIDSIRPRLFNELEIMKHCRQLMALRNCFGGTSSLDNSKAQNPYHPADMMARSSLTFRQHTKIYITY